MTRDARGTWGMRFDDAFRLVDELWSVGDDIVDDPTVWRNIEFVNRLEILCKQFVSGRPSNDRDGRSGRSGRIGRRHFFNIQCVRRCHSDSGFENDGRRTLSLNADPNPLPFLIASFARFLNDFEFDSVLSTSIRFVHILSALS